MAVSAYKEDTGATALLQTPLQAFEAAKVREAADLKLANLQGEMAHLQQQLSAMEEARAAARRAVQMQLDKEKLAKQVELQVGAGGSRGRRGRGVGGQAGGGAGCRVGSEAWAG